MYKRRKGTEDKANATYLHTLDKPAEFWQVLLEEIGSMFVQASLLSFFSFPCCPLNSKVFQRASQKKSISSH